MITEKGGLYNIGMGERKRKLEMWQKPREKKEKLEGWGKDER